MAFEFSFDAQRARVARGELRQHEVQALDGGTSFVLATALGLPRLWGYLLDAALTGFHEGLERQHDGRPSTRLHQGLDAAHARVRAHADALIERSRPDVGLLALCFDQTQLHVLCVGPARAYVHRHASTRRLTPREDRAEGVLKARPTFCAETLEPGDLILAGSLTACSEASLGGVSSALQRRGRLAPYEVVALLNKPAAASGLGAAALAVQLPKF